MSWWEKLIWWACGYTVYTTEFGRGGCSKATLTTYARHDSPAAVGEHVQLVNQFENDGWVRLKESQ